MCNQLSENLQEPQVGLDRVCDSNPMNRAFQVPDGNQMQRAKPSRRRSEAPKKPRRVPMKLKRPTQNRHMLQFYGIAVSPEWVQEFGRQRMAKEYLERADETTIAAYTLQLLEWLTKIDILVFEPAHNSGDAPPDCLLDGDVMILSVCSNDSEGYSDRPPQRNMDRLEEIVGRGPARWWVSSEEFY
ncbi:hypothetical protein HYDPIDRAFT_113299 [Hydnomerulius pinastri MD-312]|uniref:Uncharacterized protein n=1 Tax=Hydnomerulius pinastri MD-312 TaxID=994086 RepID=A0A0C9W7R5_9AGAM|nr:hypothetical protein HYDPIDRAFT_113299 [Hydnomerulius pinastri MD-312]